MSPILQNVCWSVLIAFEVAMIGPNIKAVSQVVLPQALAKEKRKESKPGAADASS
jgi:hypothetical protein